jgi:SAM-dependent methyltransferase
VTVVGCDLDAERLRNAREGFASLDAADGSDGATTDEAVDGDAEGEDVNGSGVTAPAFCRADAFTLPFATDAFDVVVCAEVLEHLPAYERTIDELARVLKPGGRLATSVPRYGPEWVCWALSDAYHAVEGGHVRIFRRDELENRSKLADCGRSASSSLTHSIRRTGG